MIGEIKSEMKLKLSQTDDEEQKQHLKTHYELKISELNSELALEKDIAMSEIKKRFYKRKQSIMGKLDMESAKSKLKASLKYGKNMSFLSTPSAQSFDLSPYEASAIKAQQVGKNMVHNEQLLVPVEKLMAQPDQTLRITRTPNRTSTMDFDLMEPHSPNK
jgi:hypothetical protein